MNRKETEEVINKTFLSIFGKQSQFTIEEILNKFAFDVKLPKQVKDSVTGEITWSEMENAKKFIKQDTMEKYDKSKGWMISKRDIKSLDDIIDLWNRINFTTTERVYDSENVHQSDTIYNCSNIFRSTDCRKCKNTIFSDGCADSENLIACQRSGSSVNCLRVDDSGSCSNSYSVICSAKISNSYFIQDCNNLFECMFCSHISNRRFCIANMQFEETEYYEIKDVITDWILSREN